MPDFSHDNILPQVYTKKIKLQIKKNTVVLRKTAWGTTPLHHFYFTNMPRMRETALKTCIVVAGFKPAISSFLFRYSTNNHATATPKY